MATSGKAAMERVKGTAKVATGKATGDKELELKGRAERAKGNVRSAASHLKKAAK